MGRTNEEHESRTSNKNTVKTWHAKQIQKQNQVVVSVFPMAKKHANGTLRGCYELGHNYVFSAALVLLERSAGEGREKWLKMTARFRKLVMAGQLLPFQVQFSESNISSLWTGNIEISLQDHPKVNTPKSHNANVLSSE